MRAESRNRVARPRRAWAVALLASGLIFAPAAAQSQGILRTQTAASAPLWWPGFIDVRGKAFLELPDDAKLCGLARDVLRKAGGADGSGSIASAAAKDGAKSGARGIQADSTVESGRVIPLPLKVETLLPRGARLAFGVIDTQGNDSERVLTRVVTIARGTDKGACAHLAEAGADAPGYMAEEDRAAFGVHPPRPLALRAPLDAWRSFGAAGTAGGTGGTDGRFAAAADAPPAWRELIAPLVGTPQELFGQRFAAVLDKGAQTQVLSLIGAIAPSPEYSTLNMIVREGETSALYQSGLSGGFEKNRMASFVAQVLGAIDLDGDGVDEIVLRARYYSGGNLRVLRLTGGRFVELRGSAYEGE